MSKTLFFINGETENQEIPEEKFEKIASKGINFIVSGAVGRSRLTAHIFHQWLLTKGQKPLFFFSHEGFGSEEWNKQIQKEKKEPPLPRAQLEKCWAHNLAAIDAMEAINHFSDELSGDGVMVIFTTPLFLRIIYHDCLNEEPRNQPLDESPDFKELSGFILREERDQLAKIEII